MRRQILKVCLGAMFVGTWMSNTSFDVKAEELYEESQTDDGVEDVGVTEVAETPENGWEITEAGRRYYENGEMVTNCTMFILGANYGFDANGYAVLGWWTSADGGVYYFGEDYRGVRGLQTIEGSLYCFSYGKRYTNETYYDTQGKIFYYFGSDGKCEEQKTAIEGGNCIGPDMYYIEDGNIRHGLRFVDGYGYYFNPTPTTNAFVPAKAINGSEDDVYYYFGSDGRLKIGMWEAGDGTLCYSDENGAIRSGLFTYNGDTYCSDFGTVLCNEGYGDVTTNSYYWLDEDGKLAYTLPLKEGFVQIGNKTIYVTQPYAGRYERVKYDWVQSNGAWYYFDRDGFMVRNEIVYDWVNENSVRYRTDANGKRLENKWYINEEGNWEYYGADGIAPEGLCEINGVKYYFGSAMLTDMTINKNGYIYIIDSNGKTEDYKLTPGWNKIAGEWYYCENGEAVVGRWKKIGDYWYSFDAWGRMNHDTLVTNWNGGHYDSGRVDSNGHRVFGWYKIADKMWEYYGADGVAVTGLQTINGVTYYFNNNGIMMTGIIKEFPNYYRLDENGKLLEYTSFKDGWNSFDGKWYYVQNGEICVNRWVTSGGYKYYLRYDGTMAVGRNSVNENGKYTFYEFDEKGHMITGWSKTKTGDEQWCYYDSDGRGVEGLQTINGKMYYFTYGIMVTRYTFVEDGKIYSCGSDGVVKQISTSNGWYQGIYYVENGKLVTGWKKIDNKWYYYDSMGIRTTGLCPELNYNYYFDDDGVMQTGWIKYKSYWMWADSSGKLVENGWMSINGKSYYFIDKIMETGICKFDGYWTWFDANGNRLGATKDTEKWIKTGKGYYYIMKDGTLATGEVLIGGKYYYFNPDGLMQTGYAGNGYYGTDGAKVKNTWVEVSYKTWMYFDNNGNAANGWLKLDNKWYYFTRGYYRVGDEVIDGKKYHFDNAGVWDGKTVQIADGWYLIDGKYKYRENGHDVVGVKVINGSEYYFDYSGVMVTSQYNGITKAFYGENGKRLMNGWGKSSRSYYGQVDWWYYANNGELYAGLHTIGGKQYYFDEYNRNMITTDYLNPTQTIFYEIGSDGVVKEIVKANGTGWIKTKSGKWLYSENGIFYKDMHALAGKYYYFEQGVMVKNQIVNGYGYFDSTGVLSKWEGWQKVNGRWAYLHNGYCGEGSRYIDGKWYYFEYTQDSDVPVVFKGLYSYERNVYYYNGADGGRTTCSVKEGWNKLGDEWYYVVDGAPAWGALKISGKWYYFSDGVMMHDATVGFLGDDSRFGYCGSDGMLLLNAWKKIGDVWYYFGSDGRYVTGTHTINGVVYHFSNSGILQD